MQNELETSSEDTNIVEEKTSDSAERLFTQDELNKVISNRLDRERVSRSNDVDLVKDKVKTLSQELDDANEQLSNYEKLIRAQLAEKMKDLPQSVRELVDKLDPVEQLDWLESNASEVQTKTATKKVAAVPIPTEVSTQSIQDIMEKKRTERGNIYGEM